MRRYLQPSATIGAVPKRADARDALIARRGQQRKRGLVRAGFERVGEEGYRKAPVGAGPYKFVSFNPGVELVVGVGAGVVLSRRAPEPRLPRRSRRAAQTRRRDRARAPRPGSRRRTA